ncbi:MAG: DUF58 domain-containing protein [Nitrososphaerota archaeon]|nr:DUF58 domain-containing protein [Nitrososphaerota archaeon]
MLTRKAGLIAAFGLWTFVLGLALGSPTVLLASVPVVLYLAVMLLGSRPHIGVTVTRTMPPTQTHEGDEAKVLLRVRNDGPSVDLELVDELPPGIAVSGGSNHIFARLSNGESRDFTYAFSPQLFGAYTFGPIRLRASDRASMRYEEKVEKLTGTLRVYPRVDYIKGVSLSYRRPRSWPGETTSRRAGQGLEFYGIREHLSGDPLRRVNWKASGRTGRLMLNQFMNETGGETVIVLDLRSTSRVGTPPDTVAAHSVRAAATLSYRLLRDRNRVGLMGIGKYLTRVPPGFGRRQFEKILAGLVSSEVSDEDWGLDMVPYYIALYYSRMVQLVLVTPLADRRPLYLTVNLARKGYDVIVVSPSVVGLDQPRGHDPRTVRLAKELAEIDRDQKIASLRKYARVVDWNPTLPLGDALEGLREDWRARRRA